MNPFQIIATLRKFGNYLAGLFPALVPLIEKLSRALEKLASHEKAAPLVARARESQTGQSLWKFIERFYWRTYSKDRLALEEAPAEAVPVIRPVFQLCAMLCALIPITQLTLWPTAIETFSGFKGSAPAWSILLWPLALAIGWSALLIGAACCNRLVFAFTALASGWFLSTCVLLLPRSWMNLFLPAGILLALAFGERRKKLAGQDQSGSDKLPAAAAWTAIATGCAAGIPAMLFTPLKPYLTAVLPMTGAVIGIGGGALIGLAAAFLVLFWARLPAVAEKPFLLRGGPLSMAAAAQGLTLLLLIYLCAVMALSGFDQMGLKKW